MNLNIKKIELAELEEFCKSVEFKKFNTIPISEARVKSYVNNPHAHANDVVLLLGFLENKLVAFRTLWADFAYLKTEKVRFAWCSGNWVHPDFRRNGFSEQLLNEAYKCWKGKLMFTNYAPASEKLYLKTGLFSPIHQFEGVRAYLFPKTVKLSANAQQNKFYKGMFSILDFFIVLWSEFRLLFYFKKVGKYTFEALEKPDKMCLESIQTNDFKLLRRGEQELNWIFDFPWIVNEKNYRKQVYPFSHFSSSFYYRTIKVFEKNRFLGFFIFSVNKGHLKTLYFNLPEGLENELIKYIKQFSKSNKIELLTLYNKSLAFHLLKRKFPFLHVKKYGQKIYSSFEVDRSTQFKFQDGEGDVIFT